MWNRWTSQAVSASRDTKVDGKNGAIDGVAATAAVNPANIAETPWFFPNPPPKFPKGKESKEGKDGKDAKDGKESKEGKESKDGKEGKDTSDSGKTGGDEATNPFVNFGDPENLNWSVMNQIARIHGTQVNGFVKGTQVI